MCGNVVKPSSYKLWLFATSHDKQWRQASQCRLHDWTDKRMGQQPIIRIHLSRLASNGAVIGRVSYLNLLLVLHDQSLAVDFDVTIEDGLSESLGACSCLKLLCT